MRCACTRCTTRSTNICERRTANDTGAGRSGPKSCATRQATASREFACSRMPRPSSFTPGCSGSPTSNLAPCRGWRANSACRSGLYGDYAVGVNPSGSETWSDQKLYRMAAGVGAPPDALALKGQDWGIPPQDPHVLMAEQYQPFRYLLAANMRHFGALRLDHVMALFRQWWVPVGIGATEGGYVHYPLDDLMSVLALESATPSCLVVGEDLGTVPPEMSHAMTERAVYSLSGAVIRKARGWPVPRAGTNIRAGRSPPSRRTTCRHCAATGQPAISNCASDSRCIRATNSGLQVADERERDRAALLAALEAAGLEARRLRRLGRLRTAMRWRMRSTLYLARSAAALAVLQAEDLVGMADPVNVPGTSDEHANWQRKMSPQHR